MNISVLNIPCGNCKTTYKGFIEGLVVVELVYAADCPNCKSRNEISNQAAWLEASPPIDAVRLARK